MNLGDSLGTRGKSNQKLAAPELKKSKDIKSEDGQATVFLLVLCEAKCIDVRFVVKLVGYRSEYPGPFKISDPNGIGIIPVFPNQEDQMAQEGSCKL